MKTTYKLLNINLDGIPCVKKLPSFEIIQNKYIYELGVDYNICDMLIYERKIAITKLYSLREEIIDNLISANKDCTKLYVEIDYLPKLKINSLIYCKRLLQILYVLNSKMMNAQIVILTNENDYTVLECNLKHKLFNNI